MVPGWVVGLGEGIIRLVVVGVHCWFTPHQTGRNDKTLGKGVSQSFVMN